MKPHLLPAMSLCATLLFASAPQCQPTPGELRYLLAGGEVLASLGRDMRATEWTGYLDLVPSRDAAGRVIDGPLLVKRLNMTWLVSGFGTINATLVSPTTTDLFQGQADSAVMDLLVHVTVDCSVYCEPLAIPTGPSTGSTAASFELELNLVGPTLHGSLGQSEEASVDLGLGPVYVHVGHGFDAAVAAGS